MSQLSCACLLCLMLLALLVWLFDELDVLNESYICFRHREIKAVRKTHALQATSSDKLLRLQNELTQGLELAKTLLCRENLKRDYTQHTLQVWDKRFEFAELKHKFPSLGTKEDEELLLDKERVAKKPKIMSLDSSCMQETAGTRDLRLSLSRHLSGLKNIPASSMQPWSMTLYEDVVEGYGQLIHPWCILHALSKRERWISLRTLFILNF
ncbi:hypothetical protein BDR05DRAFT_953751 [Suillus weaverae]|nr:hypothetical protein BDR05DRAFT_953751 [Suillus weaverae]